MSAKSESSRPELCIDITQITTYVVLNNEQGQPKSCSWLGDTQMKRLFLFWKIFAALNFCCLEPVLLFTAQFVYSELFKGRQPSLLCKIHLICGLKRAANETLPYRVLVDTQRQQEGYLKSTPKLSIHFYTHISSQFICTLIPPLNSLSEKEKWRKLRFSLLSAVQNQDTVT